MKERATCEIDERVQWGFKPPPKLAVAVTDLSFRQAKLYRRSEVDRIPQRFVSPVLSDSNEQELRPTDNQVQTKTV